MVPGPFLIAVAGAYAWGVWSLGRRGRRWPWTRWVPFAAGVIVLGVALLSPLAAHDTTDFPAHVVQHLLLAMVAPPLLALGAPVTLLLQAGSRVVQRRVTSVLRSRLVAVITYPGVAWVLFGGSLIGLYFTPLYAATLRHPWLHDLLHVHFVVVGMLFFWPVVGLDPGRWHLHHGARLLYVLVALPFHAIVGLALISSHAPLWHEYSLANQQAGGGAMMLGGDLITLAIVGIVLRQWIAADERLAARLDAAASRTG